ncbi:hypothetical protein GCM10023321_68430 [Pseudonocardia eucalypti]|uniref:RND transporter n=1 Tax=Pseudonocardia eucalypti TaxID=648755 RepID=A0ABP9R2A9_9PSEU|nr:putative RND superfamily exporter protein [Pseudonocardia eucalypti]
MTFLLTAARRGWTRFRAWVTPRRAVALVVVLLLAAGVVGGLVRAKVETGIESFLPASDPSVTDLNRVGELFGGDPIVVLLETAQPRQLFEGDQIMALGGLEGRLAGLPDVAAVYGPGTLLNQIAGQTRALITELLGRRDGDAARVEVEARQAGKSDAEAKAEGAAAKLRFDQRYFPLLAQGLPVGLPSLHNKAFADHVVFSPTGPRPQWRFVVPSETSVAVLIRPREGADAAAVHRLVGAVLATVGESKLPTTRVTVSGVPTVVAALSAKVKQEAPLLGGLALLAVGLCFLLMPWFSPRRRWMRLLPLITTLTAIGLTLSAYGWLGRPLSIGVVAFLSVVLGIGTYYPTYFAMSARPRTVLTVALATAASLATLAFSPLPLARDLGVTLAVGILLSALLGYALTRTPWFERFRHHHDPGESGVEVRRVGDPGTPSGRSRVVVIAAFVVALLIAGVGWAMLPRLPLETNVQQFAAQLPAIKDAEHAENVLGSSGELDVVLTGADVTSPEAVAWMSRAEAIIGTRYGDQARRVISLPMLLTFLGSSPSPDEIASALRLMPQYLTGAVVSLERGTAVMIYGVRIDDLGGIQRLREALSTELPPPPTGYEVKLAGLPIVAVRGQELVSEDRVWSNLLGVLAAGLVLALGLRRRWDAGRAVLAAVLATGGGLFLLWATGTPLSPITVALGSLTAAVGCEFTVLLAEAHRRSNPALRRAVLLVTTTSALGYAVLMCSGIAVVREFGVLLAGAVLLALLSSLCVVRLTARAGEASSQGARE